MSKAKGCHLCRAVPKRINLCFECQYPSRRRRPEAKRAFPTKAFLD